MLANEYRCILIDFKGFGRSDEPEYPYRLRDFTNDLNTLLDELDVKECFFIAHSFGGRVAIDYVTTYVGRVKGLILADVAGLRPRRGIRYYYKVYLYKIKKHLGRDTSNMGSSDYRGLSPLMKATFINVVNEYLNDRINNIHIPTLLIWGDEDRDTPMYMARRLNKKIANSRLIVFEGRGHFAYLEESYRFYRIVRSYMEGMS